MNAVAATPDGQRILSCRTDRTVRVSPLDAHGSGDCNTFRPHNSYVTTLVALPDNQHALSASLDNTVKLFNVDDGAVLRTFKHHPVSVNCLALMPDGLRFISGSYDDTACIVYHGLAN